MFCAIFCSHTHTNTPSLGLETLGGLFECFGGGFKPRRAVGASFVKVVFKGKKLPFYSPFLHPISTYLRAVFVFSV